MKPLSPLLLILLFLMGCQYAPYADSETTKKPSWNDVIGTYYFEKQTITGDLSDQQTRFTTLTLNTDSSFKAVNLPNVSGTIDFYYDGSISAQGKWDMETVGSVAGWNSAKSIWGIELSTLPQNLQSMSFIGDKPPYKLLVTYGDPDTGAVMIFSKKIRI